MSEIEPKVKTEPEVKAETPKEEPGKKELSDEELEKISGGRRVYEYDHHYGL